ncbi:hypothetical protein [uncultured Tateyamaria sp.]|uniref:hypothetical protein n=1 Tax=uncultured Tateyamaria sp. TaxID=455651 RepID=UPI00260325F9|nr:hypothetical protein [uncultured Tateyamaria sp.]
MPNDVSVNFNVDPNTDLNGQTLPNVPLEGAAPPPPPARTHVATNGDLTAGDSLVSANGRYTATFQADGNLVVTDTTKSGSDAVLWDSGTDGDAAGGTFRIQGDGNLVILSQGGDVEWSSRTDPKGEMAARDYELVLEDNGALTLVDSLVRTPLWSSGNRLSRADRIADDWNDTQALEYIATYPDLMNALGADDDAARNHFENNGLGENRVPAFSAQSYLEANADLVEAFGTDTEKAAEHWINIGRHEGRPLAPGAAAEVPVPRFVFRDDNRNGHGVIVIDDDMVIEDVWIDNRGAYSSTGQGTVLLDDGREFQVLREGGAGYPETLIGSEASWSNLEANQYLDSENGRYRALFQFDGNLVIYDLQAEGGPQPIWDTGTGGDAVQGTLAIQADGNLVIYENGPTLPENAVWSSRTNHNDGEAFREFKLTLSDDGALALVDVENNTVLWTSDEGRETRAAGIPRPDPITARPNDEPLDASATAPLLIDNLPFDLEIPEGAVPGDYENAMMQMLTWLSSGFISNTQFETWANDLTIMAGLEQVLANGGGRLDIATAPELELRAIGNQSFAEIEANLARDFDLATGPDAAQLAAVNQLARGDDASFMEILLTWTMIKHPAVSVRFDPGDGRGGSVDVRVDGGDETPFTAWIDERIDSDNIGSFLSDIRVPREGNGRGNRTRLLLERDDGDYLSTAIRVAPNLDRTFDVVGEEGRDQVLSVLGLTEEFAPDRRRNTPGLVTDSGQNLGYGYNLDQNKRESFFNDFGSGLARSAIDTFAPDAVAGTTTTFLINAQNENVDNVSNLGNLTVIEEGGSGNRIISGAGDLNYVTTGATGGILRPGSGSIQVVADDSTRLRIEDVVSSSENASIVSYSGETNQSFQFTDDGENIVLFGPGDTYGFSLQGNGEIRVELQAGANVTGSTFFFDDTDGTFVANNGSTLSYSAIFGGDGEDSLTFNGEAVGNIIRPGDDNDYIEVGPDFRGDFSLEDSAASWMWANGDEIYENDVVVLNQPRMDARLVGEGWTMIDGDKLVAYDEDGSILAQINLTGDADNLESIYVSDGEGGITTLQSIPPEVRTKLAALGFISSVLMIVGAFFPPAAIAGAVTKFVYDAANDNLSFQNALLTAASVASAGGGLSGSGQTLAPKWVAPALRGTAAAIDGDWENFTQNLFLTAAGLEAQGLAGLDTLPLDFAKLSDSVEAGIMIVDGLESGSAFEIAEGVFLLGASVSSDGTQQLLLGGADAARIGAAIESGELSGILTATAGFLTTQGLFTQAPEFIENTPLLNPSNVNLPAALFTGASVIIDFSDAVNNGDGVGNALLEAFPGALQTIEGFTGSNPVQVFFNNLDGEVEGRNPFNQNERLIIVYEDGAEGAARVPIALLDRHGTDTGRIELADNGSYNYYIRDDEGVENFAFNHNPATDDTSQERALTPEEANPVDPIILPEQTGQLQASLDLSQTLGNVDTSQGPLSAEVLSTLTPGQRALYSAIVGKYSLAGQQEQLLYADVFTQLNEMTQDEVNDFVRDVFVLAEAEGLRTLTGEQRDVDGDGFVVTGFLAEMWDYAGGGPVSEKLQNALSTVFDEGDANVSALTSFHIDDFELDSDAPLPEVLEIVFNKDFIVSPDVLQNAGFIERLVAATDNPELQAEFQNGQLINLILSDEDFLLRWDDIQTRVGEFVDPVALFENGEAYQTGLLNADLAGIRALAQLDPNSTEFRTQVGLMIGNVAVGSVSTFIQSVLADPTKFLTDAAIDMVFEALFPPAELIELGFVASQIAEGVAAISDGKVRLDAATTPEEIEEALLFVRGGTQIVTDQLASFVGSSAVTGAVTNAPINNSALDRLGALDPARVNDVAARVQTNPDGSVTFNDDGFVPPQATPENTAPDIAPDPITETPAPETPPAEIEAVTVAGVDGSVATTEDGQSFSYTGDDGVLRSVSLDTDTPVDTQITALLVNNQLEGRTVGGNPLTFFDNTAIEIVETDGTLFARRDVGDGTFVSAPLDTSDPIAANAQARAEYEAGGFLGLDAPDTTFQRPLGDSFSVNYLSPTETGLGSFSINYTIFGEVRTVQLTGTTNLNDAMAAAEAELAAGTLPGLSNTPSVPNDTANPTDPTTPPESNNPDTTPVETPETPPDITEPALTDPTTPEPITTEPIGAEDNTVENSLPEVTVPDETLPDTTPTDTDVAPENPDSVPEPGTDPIDVADPVDPILPTPDPDISPDPITEPDIPTFVPPDLSFDGNDTRLGQELGRPLSSLEQELIDIGIDPTDITSLTPYPDITGSLDPSANEPTNWLPSHIGADQVAELNQWLADAGVTPSEVRFTPMVVGFTPDPQFTSESIIVSQALQGALEDANGRGASLKFGPVFGNLANARGEMAEGVDPNFAAFGVLRNSDTPVEFVNRNGETVSAIPSEQPTLTTPLLVRRYIGHQGRLQDRVAGQELVAQADGTSIASVRPTINIGGTEVGLSQLNGVFNEDGTFRLGSITHPDSSALDQIMPELDRQFTNLQRAETTQEFLDGVADFSWLLFQSVPLARGTAAVGHWMVDGLLRSRGLDYDSLAPGVSLDLEALLSTQQDYRDNFSNFFQGGQFPSNQNFGTSSTPPTDGTTPPNSSLADDVRSDLGIEPTDISSQRDISGETLAMLEENGDLPPVQGDNFTYRLQSTIIDSGTQNRSLNAIGIEIEGVAQDGTQVTTARDFTGELYDFDNTHDVIGHAALFIGVDFQRSDGSAPALDGFASEELAAALQLSLDQLQADGTLPGEGGLAVGVQQFLNNARSTNVGNFGGNPRIQALTDFYVDAFSSSPEGLDLAQTLNANRVAAASYLADAGAQDLGTPPAEPLVLSLTPAQSELYLRTAYEGFSAIDPDGVTQADIDVFGDLVTAGVAQSDITQSLDADADGVLDVTDTSETPDTSISAVAEPDSVQFIREASSFFPDPDAVNTAITDWGTFTSQAIQSGNGDLNAVLAGIEPSAQALAQTDLPQNTDLVQNYGVERAPGARTTRVTHPLFSDGVQPTLDHIASDWDNVLVNGAAPDFEASALPQQIDQIIAEGGTIEYSWQAVDADGAAYPIATTLIRPVTEGFASDFPFEMITVYIASEGMLGAVRGDMANRWDALLTEPAGSEQAIEGLASFLYDYGKLYWHKHGDGEIALGLMSGYLDAKGFSVPNLNPGSDLSALAFQTDREGFIDAFFDGTIFENPIMVLTTEAGIDPNAIAPDTGAPLVSSLEQDIIDAGIEPTDIQSITGYYYELAYGRNRPIVAALNNPENFATQTGTVQGQTVEWLDDPRAIATGESGDAFVPELIPVEAFPGGAQTLPDDGGGFGATFEPQYFAVMPAWYFQGEFLQRSFGDDPDGNISNILPPWHDAFSHLLMTGDEQSDLIDAYNMTDVVDYIITQSWNRGGDSAALRAEIYAELASGAAHRSTISDQDLADWQAENGTTWTPDTVSAPIVDFVYQQIEHNYQINKDARLTGLGGVQGFIADLATNPTQFWFQRPTSLPILPNKGDNEVDARPR